MHFYFKEILIWWQADMIMLLIFYYLGEKINPRHFTYFLCLIINLGPIFKENDSLFSNQDH